jgi:hypothetical protein
VILISSRPKVVLASLTVTGIVPLHYDLNLTMLVPMQASGLSNSSRFGMGTAQGSVRIRVASDRPTVCVVLHASMMNITSVSYNMMGAAIPGESLWLTVHLWVCAV